MPISRYDIVIATHPCHLNDLMSDGGYVAIGHIYAADTYGLQAVGVGTIEQWGSVTEYELVQSQFYQDLIPLVNDKIALGYQPIGGIANWANAFVQAVGKIDASGGGSGGGASELPTGEAFEVLGFDANKDLKAMKSGMAQWLGEDRQIGGSAFDFIPVTYLTGGGQRVSQGKPSLRGLSSSPVASSVASRDAGGVLSGNTATKDVELPNLKQVREMIEASQGGGIVIQPTGAAYQIMSFSVNGGTMEPMSMSMDTWMGRKVNETSQIECVPTTMFNSEGLLSQPAMRQLDALPTNGTIAFRDANGRLGVQDAVSDYHATNKKQVLELLATWRKDIEDGIIDVINGAINGGSTK